MGFSKRTDYRNFIGKCNFLLDSNLLNNEFDKLCNWHPMDGFNMEQRMTPLAYRVSQCRSPQCRKYLTFPITTQEDWVYWTAGQFQHCGQNTEFVKIIGRAEYESLLNHPGEMQKVCCDGAD